MMMGKLCLCFCNEYLYFPFSKVIISCRILPANKHCNTLSEDVESGPLLLSQFSTSMCKWPKRVKEMANATVCDCVLHLSEWCCFLLDDSVFFCDEFSVFFCEERKWKDFWWVNKGSYMWFISTHLRLNYFFVIL